MTSFLHKNNGTAHTALALMGIFIYLSGVGWIFFWCEIEINHTGLSEKKKKRK